MNSKQLLVGLLVSLYAQTSAAQVFRPAQPKPLPTLAVLETVGASVTYATSRFSGPEATYGITFVPATSSFIARVGFRLSPTRSVWFKSTHRFFEDALALVRHLLLDVPLKRVTSLTGTVTAIDDVRGRTAVEVELTLVAGDHTLAPLSAGSKVLPVPSAVMVR